MKLHALEPLVQRVILTLCEDANTPRALTVAILLRHDEYGQLFNLKTDPLHYLFSSSFQKDNAVTEILRKIDLKGSQSTADPRESDAVRTFYDCELGCLKANRRMDKHLYNSGKELGDLRIDEFIDKAQVFCRNILGDIPDELIPRFGPGATFGDRGALATIPDKMTSQPTQTSSFTPLFPFLERSWWFRAKYEVGNSTVIPETVRGNRFITVPKDTTKFRGICIEPSMNVSLQLAVGAVLKKRMRIRGHDLSLAQDKHRSLAQSASRDDSLATIDLSNASDTVAYNVVKLLLPTQWFDLLDTLRSSFTLIRGKWVRLEKFSSMGNGFTFELETLIFAALCHASGAGRLGLEFSVYGDDIIVPKDCADTLLSSLAYFGFTPNRKKTFVSGRFRESCGGDFFDGVDVRAHYIKEEPNEPQDWIKLANGLRRLGLKDPGCDFRDSYPFRAWLRCLDNLPAYIRRIRGPVHLGDLVIHDDRYHYKWRNGCSYVAVYRPLTRPIPLHHWWPPIQLAAALYGVPSGGPVARDSVSGYKCGYVAAS